MLKFLDKTKTLAYFFEKTAVWATILQKYCIHEERRQDFYYFCLIIVDVILIFYYAQGGYFDEFVNKNSDRSWSWYHCRSGTGCRRCRFTPKTWIRNLFGTIFNEIMIKMIIVPLVLLVSRHWCLQFGGYQKDTAVSAAKTMAY